MASLNIYPVLCPICFQGRRAGTITMPKHNITPWESCEGVGQPGHLPDEVTNHFTWARWGLIRRHQGVITMWRWRCSCGQRGSWQFTEEGAAASGRVHSSAANKRDGDHER